jgi:hypothetical protein
MYTHRSPDSWNEAKSKILLRCSKISGKAIFKTLYTSNLIVISLCLCLVGLLLLVSRVEYSHSLIFLFSSYWLIPEINKIAHWGWQGYKLYLSFCSIATRTRLTCPGP